ncbi:general secretion pathway protein GspB [Lysobacter sp.]|uniref:general secretion pathway protein GspB n=1 Tax=Lysobacter sp. TaxID=72226 RepID=UPI002D7424BA|nr:general secretion pathway protein GspB [Lysobacter sp.]HZX76650.1 general secretion pathway protein GspB [Lysobacter sp.]
MSLILDALRKSEAERRRGQVPDLHAELPPRAPATAGTSRSWVWWMVGSLLVLLIAGAFAMRWWQPGRVAAPVTAAPAEVTPPRAIAPAITSEPVTPAVQPLASPEVTAAARPAPKVVQPPSAAPVAQVEAPPASEPQPASRPAPAAVAPPVAAMPAPVSAAPAPTVDPAPSPSPPVSGTTLRLADLSPAEREQLPALKISMHMWGPTPAQRFAIIDGTRVGQGDRVGEAVVEEIVADGVVLSWHGRRLALPLR